MQSSGAGAGYETTGKAVAGGLQGEVAGVGEDSLKVVTSMLRTAQGGRLEEWLVWGRQQSMMP